MKKLLAGLLISSMIAINTMPVFAYNGIEDVNKDYWAQPEIASVVTDSVMTLNNGNFYPERRIARVDFVKTKVKVLDVAKSGPDHDAVARSQQLGLVYGYPNGVFKPQGPILRDEAQSVISHITIEGDVDEENVLSKYSDASKVPAWAKHVYAKTLSYGIYVNHPNENQLRPTDELTRAEAAVLLYRLRQRLDLVEDKYKKSTETILGTEHLTMVKKAPSHDVTITNQRNIILEGNVLEVAFNEQFKSKLHAAGDSVTFTNP